MMLTLASRPLTYRKKNLVITKSEASQNAKGEELLLLAERVSLTVRLKTTNSQSEAY